MYVVAFVTTADRAAGELDVLSLVHGQTLLTHAVRGLLDSGYVDLVVVAAPARRVVMFRAALDGLDCRVVEAESVQQAAEAVDEPFDIALVHDGDRAFTPASVVQTVVEAVRAGAGVVVPVLPMSDTVKLVDAGGVILGTQDRDHLRTAQTPVGYTRAALEAQDLAGALLVEGHPNAMRVTSRFGLVLAEAAVAAKEDEASL